ncbi:MAG: YcxB family protein [Colwellia sp.]|nr:YcxB family protein [Colwellia sp.]MCW9080551.1 YcxB family protein [Colwellia sp.]
MTSSTLFTSKFILDKPHFNECYSQTNTVDRSSKAYLKSGILTVFGLYLLLFTQVNAYAAWFVIALGVLEAVSLYYHQPWWVMRQMLSKASNSEVTVTIDEQGILSESFYHTGRILWQDITELHESSLGFVISFTIDKSAGKSYLSKSCLSTDAQNYILQKSPKTPSKSSANEEVK